MTIAPVPLVNIQPRQMSDIVPFTYRGLKTYTELLNDLRDYVVQLSTLQVSLRDAYLALIDDANAAINLALESINGLSAQYDAALVAMDEKLIAQLAEVNVKVAQLDQALEDVAAANETAQGIVATFNEYVTAFTATLTTYGERLQTIETDAVTNVKKSELVINVKDYGAKGDNVTDDTAAINAAATAAGNWGSIFFPPGTYKHSGTLTQLVGQNWHGNAWHMQGDGSGSSAMLRYTGMGDAFKAGVAGSLERLCLLGPGKAVAGSVGVNLVNAGGYTIRDCTVRAFGTGINASQVWYLHLDRIYLYHSALNMRIDYCYNVSIYNVRSHSGDPDGTLGNAFSVERSSTVTFHGGSIEGYQTAVFVGSNTYVTCYGVYMETKTAVSATGFNLRDSVKMGLVLSGCQVYTDNHRSWVDMSISTTGTLVANANKFKTGSGTGGGFIYRYILPAAALRLDIRADNLMETDKEAVSYVGAAVNLPSFSTVEVPYNANVTEGMYTSKHIRSTMFIAPGVRNAGESLPNSFGVLGALIYDTERKKLLVYGPTGWTDAVGGAI